MILKQNFTGNLYSGLKYMKQKVFNSNRYKLTKRTIQYLQSKDCTIPAADSLAMQKYFSKTLIQPISYPFISEYLYKRINVLFDNTKSLYYVYHNKKKLYFKKGLSKTNIRDIYNQLCIEQDVRSPHSYFAFPICYQSTDIVADIGAAEGVWALDIVEKVKEIYLFECDEEWIEALQATFEPWSYKIHIVNKFVSDFSDEMNTALDDYFFGEGKNPDIIKVDIEGAEAECLNGASKLLSHYIRDVLLCTYHKFNDFTVLSKIMEHYNFEVQSSEGYMLFIWEEPNYNFKDIATLFRKGLIYARK